ncbi:hypothetical protein M0R45_008527 [Rubus argutus]|uniref:Uncharacterized protein n=1 Tax=Rubus argutus TaxID=59490 RepID=A0AAW1Y4P2_RUBAR
MPYMNYDMMVRPFNSWGSSSSFLSISNLSVLEITGDHRRPGQSIVRTECGTHCPTSSNYLGGTLIHLVSGFLWCFYIYYLKRNLYVPKVFSLCNDAINCGQLYGIHDGRKLKTL